MIIIIFQPELRRALEQLGTNKFKRFLGIDEDIKIKTKENIYKIAIAATELSKARKGALIVIEREIKIKDIISTGIAMNSEISPQLLVNIFEPKTPLHDGAVVISENKIAAAACMLPLSDDKDIARELGTRHRAAIGISNESDALAVVVSEETGKISIAKDGTLIADVREDVLKKILIKNLVIENPVQPRKKDESKKDRCIALRADIDGLPMDDKKTCSYSSKVKGRRETSSSNSLLSFLFGSSNLAIIISSSFLILPLHIVLLLMNHHLFFQNILTVLP